MARQSLADIHEEAMLRCDDIQSVMRAEREQCLQDRRFAFIAGAQWEGALAEQFENKPMFEVNKIALAIMRIFSEYRNNRITVDFVSKEGDEYDELADVCDGLYRADEQDSVADEAYDNAFDEAVSGGFGAYRLCTEYENEYEDEDERQRIRIEPIFDADSSVFFDLNSKRQDKADAKFAFVLTSVSMDYFKSEYKDDPASWPKFITQANFDWCTDKVVYIAEYYRVETGTDIEYTFTNLVGEEETYTQSEFDDDEELRKTLEATGSKETSQRNIKFKRIRKFIMSGGKILKDCGFIAGNNIPIVPVYGKRFFIDNVERCMGHVRLVKDSQRLKNMQLSKLGELAAYSSIEKPIFTPEQISGHEMRWAEDNIRDYPYLLVNALTDAQGNSQASGPVSYTHPPQIPPAMAALLQITEQDMQDLLGNQQQMDKMVSNISGKAVEMIQQRVDMQSYIYLSNMAKAIKRGGEIWLGMARDIYVEKGRKMKSISTSGESSSIELMKPMLTDEGLEITNDIRDARFDVAVDVGPSSTTKRQALAREIMGVMQVTQDPETIQVLTTMAISNMEGEGMSDIRAWARKKLINIGAAKPTQKEIEVMQAEAAANNKPDPNAILMQSMANEAEAKAQKAHADVLDTLASVKETEANIKKIEAETLRILAETEATHLETSLVSTGEAELNNGQVDQVT